MSHRLTLDVTLEFAETPCQLVVIVIICGASIRNIAEALAAVDPDFRVPLHALGSLNELEYDLLLARDLVPPGAVSRAVGQLDEVKRMLSGLRAQLRNADRCELTAGTGTGSSEGPP